MSLNFDLVTHGLTAASGMMLKNEMTNLTVAGQLTNLAVDDPIQKASITKRGEKRTREETNL
jgi:hypothetical protein